MHRQEHVVMTADGRTLLTGFVHRGNTLKGRSEETPLPQWAGLTGEEPWPDQSS